MKTKLISTILIAHIVFNASAQCDTIPVNSTTNDSLSYHFAGGVFVSDSCSPADTVYWLTGNGPLVAINFVTPQSYPSFRVWEMNADDIASVTVNGTSYPLNSTSASYDPKVLCGLSPGPDGISFSGGYLTGVNSNSAGNYSFQNIRLNITNVNSMEIASVSGSGWGFSSVSLHCPLDEKADELTIGKQVSVYPNPFNSSATIQINTPINDATLNLYNLYGQKLKTIQNLSGSTTKIDRGNLPAGIYFLSFTQNGSIIAVEKITITD